MAHAAEDLDVRAIAIFTETGITARLLSKYRPNAEIFRSPIVPAVRQPREAVWGVRPSMQAHAAVKIWSSAPNGNSKRHVAR